MAQTQRQIAGSAPNKTTDFVTTQVDNLSVTGFSIVCAWHFLIIFTALPSTGTEALQGRSFFFQAALYLSLAGSYIVLMFISKPVMKLLYRKGAESWKRANIGLGIVASLATLFTVLAHDTFFVLELVSWVAVGLSEAMLMFPWLQLPGIRRDKINSPQNFAFNMGIGGITAFVIGNLVCPYNYIALCLLPLFANWSLGAIWEESDAKLGSDDAYDKVRHAGHLAEKLVENSHFVFYGFAFGVCQYIFSVTPDGPLNVSYIVNSSWPICGVIISAFIVLLIPTKSFAGTGVLTIQHLSALIYMIGIVVSFYFIASSPLLDAGATQTGTTVGQAFCFAGFNTFDFGFMIFAFAWSGNFKTNFASFIGFNRAVLYLSMACGLFAGLGMDLLLPQTLPNHIIAITGAVIVLLTASTFPYFDRFLPHAKAKAPASGVSDTSPVAAADLQQQEPMSAQERRLVQIADACQLSKREREVFSFLAKGMNANEIQQELWISIHTVKTHMSNVYHKLGVHSARELIELVEAQPDAGSSARDANASNTRDGRK